MASAFVQTHISILHMIILPISKLDEVLSPEVFIYGIPWQVKARKSKEENSLGIYLRCAKTGDSSNWTVPGCSTITLLPFGQNQKLFKQIISPSVYNSSNLSYGVSNFILWDELLKKENEYVQNDKIKLKIEISAEDPNNLNRSVLKLETIDKSCDCGSHATFRLTVTNVENLMAICSPRFTVRNVPWDLAVYKDQRLNLGIELWNKSSEETSCRMKMSVKLLSSNDDVDPIEGFTEKQIQQLENLWIKNIISWDEMLKPDMGFVNNDYITLEVKIRAGKPDGDIPNVDVHHVAKRRRLECSICFEDMDNQDISTTPCGHLFCTTCITEAVKNRSVCPMCQKKVESVQRIYLPQAK